MNEQAVLCHGNENAADLKVDVAVRQPASTALVQEVDVFNEQAEERDDDLEDKQDRDGGVIDAV